MTKIGDFEDRSPGLVVMGRDSCSKGRGFESRHSILDGHFFTYICCKNCNDIWLKWPKINEKEAANGPFFKNRHFRTGSFSVNLRHVRFTNDLIGHSIFSLQIKGWNQLSVILRFSCFAYFEWKTVSFVLSNPNQSRRKSAIRWYFPLTLVISALHT